MLLAPTVTLGDSALVALSLLAQAGDATADAPGREVQVCDRIDTRTLFADPMAHLELHADPNPDRP